MKSYIKCRKCDKKIGNKIFHSYNDEYFWTKKCKSGIIIDKNHLKDIYLSDCDFCFCSLKCRDDFNNKNINNDSSIFKKFMFDNNGENISKKQKPYEKILGKNWIFYYDETNNHRVFHLTKNGFNVNPIDDFILGGIFLKKNIQINKWIDLKKVIGLENNEEIKFNKCFFNATKLTFEKLLEDSNFGLIIEFCLNNNIFLHYNILDNYYWAIIDILCLDTLLENIDCINITEILKDALYIVFKEFDNSSKDIMIKYCYPNIKKNEINNFYCDIIKLISSTRKLNNNIQDCLILALENAKSYYVSSSEKSIESYNWIFIKSFAIWEKYKHVFDNENKIIKEIKRIETIKIKTNNFEFYDSKNSWQIQLSDVVIGILRKYYSFITKTTLSSNWKKDTNFFIENLNEKKLENIKKFICLLERSEAIKSLICRIFPRSKKIMDDYFCDLIKQLVN